MAVPPGVRVPEGGARPASLAAELGAPPGTKTAAVRAAAENGVDDELLQEDGIRQGPRGGGGESSRREGRREGEATHEGGAGLAGLEWDEAAPARSCENWQPRSAYLQVPKSWRLRHRRLSALAGDEVDDDEGAGEGALAAWATGERPGWSGGGRTMAMAAEPGGAMAGGALGRGEPGDEEESETRATSAGATPRGSAATRGVLCAA